MVKNPNWQEADQLAIYKRGRGVELGATEKQLLLAVRAGPPDFKSGTLTHSTTLPPIDQGTSTRLSTSMTNQSIPRALSLLPVHGCLAPDKKTLEIRFV